MPGLVPGIHVLLTCAKQDVDGRGKPGHDEIYRKSAILIAKFLSDLRFVPPAEFRYGGGLQIRKSLEAPRMEFPPLPYVAVPESFELPPGANFGGTSGVAFHSKGNIFGPHRGPMPLMEFDADGNFIRGFGDGLFDRPHGLRIDKHDNIWATDVAMNLVYKFHTARRIEMVLGVKGGTGEWKRGGHLGRFHENN